MATLVACVRTYASAEEMRSAYRQIGARLYGGVAAPALQATPEPEPELEPEPIDPLPPGLPQPYRYVVMAVAAALDMAPMSVLGGVAPEDCRGRSIAAAVTAHRFDLPPDSIAEQLGVGRGFVAESLRTFEIVISRAAVSAKWSDLGAVVAACAMAWPLADVRPAVTVRVVKQVFADTFGVTVREIESVRRTKGLVAVRHMAMAVSKHLTSNSLPEIGHRFGGRDHTTVLHACRKCAALVEQVGAELPDTATVMDWARAMRRVVS
ncbi:helix-turn-helix domain-containing protein [Xanthobacteraceae bacterium Astr-EGSB]|uniref:helix-turn-helix domain-containing protein n=1 Tax=Astrobacterium formosum TaxID=3069710 RepID=UPI0027B4895A|nr:helix-turn-helix domain-containing protein [Xanthobacteraceae bacterium Astr-EGSB]